MDDDEVSTFELDHPQPPDVVVLFAGADELFEAVEDACTGFEVLLQSSQAYEVDELASTGLDVVLSLTGFELVT